jgi:DNA replication protein DnaC
MLDTLQARLAQANAGELGHQQFLQELCEDETARRAAAAVTRRVRAAGFAQLATIEKFDFTVSAKLPVAALRDLATLRFLDAGDGVVLHGPVGIGTATSPRHSGT